MLLKSEMIHKLKEKKAAWEQRKTSYSKEKVIFSNFLNLITMNFKIGDIYKSVTFFIHIYQIS